MSNHDKIFQARIDIETAAEISHATISEVMDNVNDDPCFFTRSTKVLK